MTNRKIGLLTDEQAPKKLTFAELIRIDGSVLEDTEITNPYKHEDSGKKYLHIYEEHDENATENSPLGVYYTHLKTIKFDVVDQSVFYDDWED